MDCVVRTDQKVRSRALQGLSGTQHKLSHRLLPACACINGLHVLSQSDGMHGDFRMRMLAHEGFSFQTDSAIAKGRAFCAASDNANMPGHKNKVIPENRSGKGT